MGIMSGIKTVMGFGGVSDTVNGIVKKIAGTDLPPDKAVELLVKYQNATKHQSPARRFIAACVTLAWLALGFVWLVAKIIARAFSEPVYNESGKEVLSSMSLLASDVSAFMSENVTTPFGLVLGFYFTMGIINSARK